MSPSLAGAPAVGVIWHVDVNVPHPARYPIIAPIAYEFADATLGIRPVPRIVINGFEINCCVALSTNLFDLFPCHLTAS